MELLANVLILTIELVEFVLFVRWVLVLMVVVAQLVLI